MVSPDTGALFDNRAGGDGLVARERTSAMRTTKATIIYLGDEDEIIVETETHSVRIGCYRDPIPTEDNPSYSLRIECPQGFDENELVKQADESTWQLEDAYHTTNRSWIFPH